MSQFASAGGDDGSSDGGSAAFFRRLRKGVSDLSRPSTPGRPSASAAVVTESREGSSTETQASAADTPAASAGSTNSRDHTGSASSSSSSSSEDGGRENNNGITTSIPPPSTAKPYKIQRYESILQGGGDQVDLGELRKLSWNGAPHEFRTTVWQLLLGYLPSHKGRRDAALVRKRKEYADAIHNYYDIAQVDREGDMMTQILKDLPRTSPDLPFFQQPPIQKSMERILYIWSTRHPASGYVQGMNDLLTPLLVVSLYPYVAAQAGGASGASAGAGASTGSSSAPTSPPPTTTISDVLRCDVASLSPSTVMHMECDAYWCLTRLLDNIQDHYTDAQPGLQRMQMKLEDLMKRIDAELHAHFEEEGLMYVQFSFRWMNCLLLRELPLKAILRVWDTYLSEERSGFENFHVYVCAVLLKTFRETLLPLPFQDMILLLQDLPTREWTEDDVEPVLSQAFILSTLFEDSPSHLR